MAQPSPSINVTPLIDVLLVLLIIFMVVGPAHPALFDTRVPAKPADPAEAAPESLVVTVDRSSAVTLNSVPFTPEGLEARLAEELAGRADRTVVLRASTALPCAVVVGLVDRITGAGASPVGLQIDLLES